MQVKHYEKGTFLSCYGNEERYGHMITYIDSSFQGLLKLWFKGTVFTIAFDGITMGYPQFLHLGKS